MVTHESTRWPVWLFWIGLAFAFASLAEYALKAKREAFA
jgi:hypothetical protein